MILLFRRFILDDTVIKTISYYYFPFRVNRLNFYSNASGIWTFSNWCSSYLSSWRYVWITSKSNAFTFWLTPETVAAGASTSLFGLFAAIVVLSFLGKNQALKDLGKSYQTLIVVNLLMNLFMPNVSMAGHIGGVVGGALLSIVFPTKMRVITVKKTKRMLALVSYGIILVGVLVLGFL
ncbi:TPA: rhomboid family intramembrane serine protease [Streptococcus pyogenes]|nr:rhomboid family intramembrane serine protease [Streptococcus pyogenes]